MNIVDTVTVLLMQFVVMCICIILGKDIRKEIEYNLIRIRAGFREITKPRALGLLAELLFMNIFAVIFLILVCANSYRLFTYIY